jgi:hypothetical protein
MASYQVANMTNPAVTIWWRDAGWNSGDLRHGDVRTVDSDHDADVTMFGKDGSGDHEWGRVWIQLGKRLEVYGDKNWALKPE